jgi:hypothetical protein
MVHAHEKKEEIMRYMLLMMCDQETAEDSTPESEAVTSGEPCWMPWHKEMEARGVVLVDGGQLQPASASTTVRMRGGEALVSDGPFAETKEQIGGYDVIECADLDEAIYAASRHPVALAGASIEVRPIMATE